VQKLNQNYIYKIVRQALREDLEPSGDVTTRLINNKKSKAKIIAEQNGVVAGLDFCKSAFKLIGREAVFSKKVRDGKKVKKGELIATISANTKTILTAERTALNFLCHASGIATLTDKFVKKSNKKTKICCTRKTTPNLRLLEKYSVMKGGGFNHRYNLSDEIMIKDNHISAESNLRRLIKKAIKTRKIITVEVDNIKQLKKILGLKFKRVLFDNMNIKNLKKCLKLCKNKYETEYSGNVNLKNIRQISMTKVNRISIGSITHSARTFNASLELSK
jgi:nicotinate-nucleotide pyrophosphorylase (carboxylating)